MSRRTRALIADVRRPKQATIIDPLMRQHLEAAGSLLPEPCRIDGEEYADDFWREDGRARVMTRLRRHGKLAAAIAFTLCALPLLPTAESSDAADVVPTGHTLIAQVCLRQFGYAVVTDSIYGPQTTRAVVHFQQANGLLPDGIAGPRTMAAFHDAGCRINFAPPYVPSAPAITGSGPDAARAALLAEGATSAEVNFAVAVCSRESGCRLEAHNYNARTHDDSYGPWQMNYYGTMAGLWQRLIGPASVNTSSWRSAARAFLTAIRTLGTCPWDKENGYCS